MGTANKTEVERLSQLKSDQLYKLRHQDGREGFFTIEKFRWYDKNGEYLGVTESGDLELCSFDTDEIDYEESVLEIDYEDGYYVSKPVQNIKDQIENRAYFHIGPYREHKSEVPNK